MKTLLLTLGLMAACVRAGYAVEYVTLVTSEEVSVAPTSVIECVFAHNLYEANSTRLAQVQFTFDRDLPAGGRTSQVSVRPGDKVTGVVSVKNDNGNWGASSVVTFKITPANELNVVAPTSMLVIPENSTGNYNIVVETSSDTATWTPFHSQTVSANDAKRFFRTRIVKAE